MNWTEGNLARHSRGRKHKDEFLRQKEHFAKVRAGLLNPKITISSPSVSLFDQAPYSISGASPRSRQRGPSNPFRQRSREATSPHISRYFGHVNTRLPDPSPLQKEQAEAETLGLKRQKLLMKRDWVGTDLQKPIQLEFSKPRTALDNPWGSRPSRHSSKQKFRHMLGLNANNVQIEAVRSGLKNPMSPSRVQLKIRVGDTEKDWDGGSCISSCRRSSHGVDFSASGMSMSHSLYLLVLTMIGHTKKRHRTLGHSNNGEKCAQREGHPDLESHTNTHRSSDWSDQSRISPNFPSLHHPVPCHPTLPRLLRFHSDESETAESNVAQIGIQKPEPPLPQRHDNEVWRTFVIGHPNCSKSSDMSPQPSPQRALISPGVSQYGQSEQPASLEGENATGSPLTGILGEDDGSEGAPIQAFSGSPPTDHTFSAPFTGNIVCETSSLLFPSEDLRNSGGTPCNTNPNARLSLEDTTAAFQERSSQDTNPDIFLSDHGVTSTEGQACEPQQELTQQTDTISVMTSPDSADPNPNDTIKCFPQSSLIYGQSKDENCEAVETNVQSHDQRLEWGVECMGAQNLRGYLNDENDLWRKFVFGDSSDGFDEAMEDAREQTMRMLCPSTTSTDGGSGNGDVPESALSGEESKTNGHRCVFPEKGSQVKIQRLSFTNDFVTSDISSASMANVPASHIATAGNSSSDALTEELAPHSDIQTPTDQATFGSSSSASSILIDQNSNLAQCSDLWSSFATGGDTNSNLTRPQPARERHRPDANFKFVQPRPYLGKRVSQIDGPRQISLSIPQVRGKNKTSRRQRRHKDGRTAIRALPDFNGDPIEEFEEDVPSRENETQSIFGSLEVEPDP